MRCSPLATALLISLAALSLPVAYANYFQSSTCWCHTPVRWAAVYQNEYHSNRLDKTWTWTNTCTQTIPRLYMPQHARSITCDLIVWDCVDDPDHNLCVHFGVPQLDGKDHYGELRFPRKYKVGKATKPGNGQGTPVTSEQCEEVCRNALGPSFASDGPMTPWCGAGNHDLFVCSTQRWDKLKDF